MQKIDESIIREENHNQLILETFLEGLEVHFFIRGITSNDLFIDFFHRSVIIKEEYEDNAYGLAMQLHKVAFNDNVRLVKEIEMCMSIMQEIVFKTGDNPDSVMAVFHISAEDLSVKGMDEPERIDMSKLFQGKFSVN